MVHAYCFSWQSSSGDQTALSSNLTIFLSDIWQNFSMFSTTTSRTKPVITRKNAPLPCTRLIKFRTYQRFARMNTKLEIAGSKKTMSDWPKEWVVLLFLNQYDESQECQLIYLHWPKTLSSKCMNSLLMRPKRPQSSHSCIWGRLPCNMRIRRNLALCSSPWASWERFSSTYDSRCTMNGNTIIIA